MSDDSAHRRGRFTRWQWAEIWVLIVVIAAQLVLNIVVQALIASALVGLVALALIVHCYTWVIPLWRKRRRTGGPS